MARRITSAHLLAGAALFVSLGSTATAAIVVTGANIKDSTVTTRDVKNGSLLAKYFKAGELRTGGGSTSGPAGATGPAGQRGADGAGGPQGERGPAGATGDAGAEGETGAPGG